MCIASTGSAGKRPRIRETWARSAASYLTPSSPRNSGASRRGSCSVTSQLVTSLRRGTRAGGRGANDAHSRRGEGFSTGATHITRLYSSRLVQGAQSCDSRGCRQQGVMQQAEVRSRVWAGRPAECNARRGGTAHHRALDSTTRSGGAGPASSLSMRAPSRRLSSGEAAPRAARRPFDEASERAWFQLRDASARDRGGSSWTPANTPFALGSDLRNASRTQIAASPWP